VVEHHLSISNLPVPQWVREPARALAETWRVSPFTSPDEVPVALARHGVLLAASELASV
jgi:hypothetical protein